jgi:hypothetical protein
MGNGPGHGNALEFAARKLVRQCPPGLREPDAVK